MAADPVNPQVQRLREVQKEREMLERAEMRWIRKLDPLDPFAQWLMAECIAPLAPHTDDPSAEIERNAATAPVRRERDEAEEAREQRCVAHAAFTAKHGDCPICDLEEAEAELDEARQALRECRELFVELRGDWSDNRGTCREGFRIIDAALAGVCADSEEAPEFCGRTDLSPHRPHHWRMRPDGSYGDYDDTGKLLWCAGAGGEGAQP